MKNLRILALSSAVLMPQSVMADTVNIVYANYLSPKHPINATLTDLFQNIEEDSDNTITFEAHFAGSLLGGRDIPAGVRDGIADSGFFIGSYVPSEMKIDTFFSELGLLNDDALAMTGVLNEMLLLGCESCANQYEEKFATKYLGSYSTTSYVYHCKEQLDSLEDFKGKTLSGFSSYGQLGESLGAAVVNMGADDAFEALDRNVIDCAVHTISSQRGRSWGDVAKYVMTEPLGGFFGGSVFNMRLEKWDELSAEQKKVIIDNVPRFVAKSAITYLDEDQAVREEYTEKGTTFYPADPDLAAAIQEFRNNYAATATKTASRRGVDNAEEILAQVTALKEKWVALLDENGRDVDTFTRLLKEEIYNKLKY